MGTIDRRERRALGVAISLAPIVDTHVELDPLVLLLDFLVGDSVETLARKNRVPNEHVEEALRAALSSYGFHAEGRVTTGPAQSGPRR